MLASRSVRKVAGKPLPVKMDFVRALCQLYSRVSLLPTAFCCFTMVGKSRVRAHCSSLLALICRDLFESSEWKEHLVIVHSFDKGISQLNTALNLRTYLKNSDD